MIPDSEPAPVPDRVLLPAPDGRHSADFVWWRVFGRELMFARAGDRVSFCGTPDRPLDDIEHDALAMLAAVRWARGQA